MNLNKVFLIGRLTQDPQTKTLPSGKVVCSFDLATDYFFVNKDGQKEQQTEFHRVVLFGKMAEIASQYLKKGSLAFIEGRLRTRSWEDANGNKKQKTEIIAQRLQLGPKSIQNKVQQKETPPVEDIPIVEEEEEINIEDIPF
jgi:single-strand DNA-binding protein